MGDSKVGAFYSLTLGGEEETLEFGHSLGSYLKRGDFIGLVGQLGAGKTSLVRGMMQAIGGHEVQSPTYTLVNSYDSSPPVHHFDLYRLEDVDELESVGYWDLVEPMDHIVFVEWIDKIPQAWISGGLRVEMVYDGESRRLSLSGDQAWKDRLSGISAAVCQ